MLIFEKVKFQNFMSYGNQWTEIDLNTKKNTLVVGKNGSGKSTMLDAITFALFGKPYRNINKPQLINSITDKNCLVELKFLIGKKKYKIRRGIKPAIFEIYVDGQLVKQDSLTKDYQTYLENNILKFNYKSFSQIVVLGSGNYIPFMQLTANARRLIIEDLLDLQVFSSMNVLLKERVVENRDALEKLDQDIKIFQSNLELHESHLKSIQSDNKKQHKLLSDKIKEEQAKIKSLEKTKSKLQDSITTLGSKLSKFDATEEKVKTINEYVDTGKKQLNKIKKELSFYSDSCSCPTCKQDIDDKFKSKMITKCEAGIEKVNSNIELALSKKKTLESKLGEKDAIVDEIKTFEEELRETSTELYAKNTLIKSYTHDMAKLIDKIELIDKSKKEELTKSLEESKITRKSLINNREVLQVAGQLLKDGGIKTLIIKQYIPVINKIINQYLNHMNFFIEFNLDDNFEETIKSRHRDEFSYNSFSEGEKSRINLAILFAWRAIAKMRNTASTNLLIFDEIFDSSLDNDGTDDFMKVLNALTGDTNVFIISHKTDNLSDRFDTILKFEKHKNFSRMEIL